MQFYKTHPAIFQSLIGKSVKLLSWTHYFVLTQEINDDARNWYEAEAASLDWSVRTLQRNISRYRIVARAARADHRAGNNRADNC